MLQISPSELSDWSKDFVSCENVFLAIFFSTFSRSLDEFFYHLFCSNGIFEEF